LINDIEFTNDNLDLLLNPFNLSNKYFKVINFAEGYGDIKVIPLCDYLEDIWQYVANISVEKMQDKIGLGLTPSNINDFNALFNFHLDFNIEFSTINDLDDNNLEKILNLSIKISKPNSFNKSEITKFIKNKINPFIYEYEKRFNIYNTFKYMKIINQL